MRSLASLTIDHRAIDTSLLLVDWRWLLVTPFEVVLLTRMGDAFVSDGDGRVAFLDTLEGSLLDVAPSRSALTASLEADDRPVDWFLGDMVASLEARGLNLGPGQCYSFRVPPVLGGSVESSNVNVTDVVVHFSISGQLHRQVKALPAETKISGFHVKR